MGSPSSRYLDAAIGVLERIRDEEAGALADAGARVATAITDGRRVFAFGCSHSSLPVQDIVYRAGGLMLINPLFAPGLTALDVRPVTLTSELERLSGLASAILDHSALEPGDVLIVVSASGRNAVPVEIAEEASKRGCTVIAVTSRAYSDSVTSRHASGKKMHEFADVVLDNKVPIGDAALEVEGVPQAIGPVSGVSSSAVLQGLVAEVIHQLVDRGVEPPVFLSGNLDGGLEYNARQLDQYGDRIFYM